MTGKKKTTTAGEIRNFTGLIKDRTKEVRDLATAIRQILDEELPEAKVTFYSGKPPMAMYRTDAEVCWLQPLKDCCNVYFSRGVELTDEAGVLEGTGGCRRYVKIRSVEQLQSLPIREWLRETVALCQAALRDGLPFDDVLAKVRDVCLSLPKTKETFTWGRPHFRVVEKIFCGVGEAAGLPTIDLKSDPGEADLLMTVPGVTKAPYSRPNDGWVRINPAQFDDWDEIQRLIVGSYRLIAPKKVSALLN